MEIVPIRCRIPELLKAINKDRKWLQEKLGWSKQQLSDYINMRYLLGITYSKTIAELLGVRIDDLYEWEWQ